MLACYWPHYVPFLCVLAIDNWPTYLAIYNTTLCSFCTASFWTVEEVDLSKDLNDWNKLKVTCSYFWLSMPSFTGMGTFAPPESSCLPDFLKVHNHHRVCYKEAVKFYLNWSGHVVKSQRCLVGMLSQTTPCLLCATTAPTVQEVSFYPLALLYVTLYTNVHHSH